MSIEKTFTNTVPPKDGVFCISSDQTELDINALYHFKGEAFYVAPGNPLYSTVDDVLFDKDKETLLFYPPKKEGAYCIPEGTKRVGTSAFCKCQHLTSLTFPSSVKEIEEFGIYECDNLRSVTFAKGLEIIGEKAFSRCSALTRIVLPEGLQCIDLCAFSDCPALEYVYIPASCIWFDDDVFVDCEKLRFDIAPDNPVAYVENGELMVRPPVLTEEDGFILPEHSSHFDLRSLLDQ